MSFRRVFALASGCLIPVFAAEAHHNAQSIYLFSDSITIEGTVTEFRFLNPHARIFLDVVDGNGDVKSWMAEGAGIPALRLRGWTGEEIKAGDRITVTGAPSRDGSPRIEWLEVTLPDGTVLGGGNNFRKERQELFQRLEQERSGQNQ
jgi:hypothetical protein